MKKAALPALFVLLSLLVSGCGNVYDREYVAVSTYVPTQSESAASEERITVRTLSELRGVIRQMVFAGEQDGRIVFDAAYEGDVAEDMASACWQVRTQDALCAYCVDNISYELNKIVTYYEASLTVSYTEAGQDQERIERMQYTPGVEERIRRSMEEREEQLVVLIQRSAYTAEDMESIAESVYHEHPLYAPQEPVISVNMFTGTGSQRLYEINFDYGMDAETLSQRMAELAELKPFEGIQIDDLDAAHRALLACRLLTEQCEHAEGGADSIYDALILHRADSKGMALAYLALCQELGVSCQLVNGQINGPGSWKEHYWNIVELDGAYYHVDPASCRDAGMENAFLLGDVAAWASYRWDLSVYPRCTGELRYHQIAGDET